MTNIDSACSGTPTTRSALATAAVNEVKAIPFAEIAERVVNHFKKAVEEKIARGQAATLFTDCRGGVNRFSELAPFSDTIAKLDEPRRAAVLIAGLWGSEVWHHKELTQFIGTKAEATVAQQLFDTVKPKLAALGYEAVAFNMKDYLTETVVLITDPNFGCARLRGQIP